MRRPSEYVQAGGRYIGFCLGAYLAGSTLRLKLLPDDVDVDANSDQKGAQVKNNRDTDI